MKIWTLLIVLVFGNLHLKAQDLNAVLTNIEKAFDQVENVKYEVKIKSLMITNTDTTKYSGTVYISKEIMDTALGFYARLIPNDSIEYWYLNYNYYYINHHSKKVSILPTHEFGNHYFKTKEVGLLIFDPLIKPIDFEDFSEDDGEIKQIICSDSKYVQIELNYPDQRGATNIYRNIWYYKTSMLPSIETFTINLMGKQQYDSNWVYNVEVNQKSTEDLFTNFTIPQGYTTENVVKKPHDYKPISLGSLAPTFTLSTVNGDSVINLDNLKGKVVLLDFWYMSCAPCLMAMPHVKALQTKYKNEDFVVLGLNWKDNDQLDHLKKFIQKQEITYPVLCSTKEVDALLKVIAYPSFYVIDKEGRIIDSQIGFSEEGMHQIDQAIEDALKVTQK